MRAVHEPLRFAAAEIRRRESVGCYRLRESGLVCCLRHHANDVGALDDVVLGREYVPPPPVARWLGALERGPRVLDLGAHVGLFALDVVARFPGCSITSVEPDPASADVLRTMLRRNGLEQTVEVIQAAAATADGEVAFNAGFGVASHVPAADDASAGQIVAAVDVLPLMRDADLVKIDIEGAEWALLGDPRAAAALGPVVALEFHARMAPPGDPEAQALELLRAAGLEIWPDIRRRPEMGALWAYDPAVVGSQGF